MPPRGFRPNRSLNEESAIRTDLSQFSVFFRICKNDSIPKIESATNVEFE